MNSPNILTFPKGENKMKDNNNSKALERKLRGIIEKRRADDAKIKEVPHQVMYDRMVQEAVLVITSEWETQCKVNSIERGTKLVARAFFVVEDTLHLYSDIFGVINPNTGKSCFYDGFKFESMDEFEKFVKDVKEQLPEDTEVVKKRKESATVLSDGPEVHVSFNFKIE